ncbi:MDR family MFS transporter [Microbacterium mangrovi]|uniref:MDR family MFS transporter n=1 Tax=Microbacterium mangrovi TaxID=1348253 RepID=UPI000AD29E4B|nr:MDR family MFS transporter [Microbacterium mangrovi]
MTHRQILFVIFGLMAGMFLSALDQTIVGTAIRTIGDDLHGLSQQAWVTTAYLIVSTIATPIYGKLSDIFGRRPLFIIAIVIFVIGSILASFSQSMTQLAFFRAVQGLGAGGLMSMPLAIMGDILAPRERAKYQGYFLAVFGVSSVIGPLVGGLFAGAETILGIAGWRWVFLINVPIGILALIIVLMFLHVPRHSRHSVRIDWWGATTVIIALVPLLLVAEQGRVWGWDSPIAIACYVIGGLGIIAFVIAETLMKDDALIPLKLFRSPTFSMATVIGVLVGFGMFGAMMTLPLYLQIVLGSSPTESGFQLFPMILGMMIASIGSGQIISRSGRYRVFPVLGTAFLAGGYFWLTHLQYNTGYWFIAGAMLLLGLGLGQLMQTLTIASQNSVEPRDMGVATSASTFFRQIGGTLGTAVLLSLMFTVIPANIKTTFADTDTLTHALEAAFDPAVATDPANAAIMEQIYTPITTKVTKQVTDSANATMAAAQQKAKDAVDAQVKAGQIPADQQQQAEQQAVQQATDAVTQAIEKNIPGSKVASDGTVTLDLSKQEDRTAFVASIVPKMKSQFSKGGNSTSFSSSAMDDTSFLNGADPRLSKPVLQAFTMSMVTVYWVGLFVMVIAFILALFFKTPPLRQKSALQQAADEDAAIAAKQAADTMGGLVEPMTSPVRVPQAADVDASGAQPAVVTLGTATALAEREDDLDAEPEAEEAATEENAMVAEPEASPAEEAPPAKPAAPVEEAAVPADETAVIAAAETAAAGEHGPAEPVAAAEGPDVPDDAGESAGEPAQSADPVPAPEEPTLKPAPSTADPSKVETGPLEVIGSDGQVRLMTRREAREALEAMQKEQKKQKKQKR